EKRILQLKLQTQRVAKQTLEQRVRFRLRVILAQTFCLQAQTRERRFCIMSESCKEFFDLRMPPLLTLRIIKKREAAADERSDQDAALPHQHRVVAMQVLSAGHTQALNEIELPQTEDKPPRCQRHGKDDPDRDKGDG